MDNAQYLNEVQKALDKDTTRLGDVWRLTKEDKSASEIAAELKVDTNTFVSGYKQRIQAIKEGSLPKSPTTASECGALRGFINRGREYLSDDTVQTLKKRAEECGRLATDLQALEEEDARSKKEMSEVEQYLTPGIYVYTYPHYYRHPVVQGKDDETDNRTYLKIGMSEKDAFKRVMQQKTGMPEPPMLLQIWVVENDSDLRKIEEKIHDHLRTVGHGGVP